MLGQGRVSLVMHSYDTTSQNNMKHVTKLTAIAVLALVGLVHLCLNFARDVMLRVYQDVGGGTETLLPVPTTFSLQATHPFSLYTATVLSLLVLSMSEVFMSKDRHRFVIQLTCVLLWSLFVTFCLWAFLLSMYVPTVVIE